jgi:cytochrome P450
MESAGTFDYDLAEQAGIQASREAPGPVRPMRLADGTTVWVVTRPSEVRKMMAHPGSSRLRAVQTARQPWPAGMTAESLMAMDAPQHSRVRAAVSHLFTPRRAETYRPQIRRIAREEIARMLRGPGKADFADIAIRLPGRVMGEVLLGEPDLDPYRLAEYGDLAFRTGGWDRQEVAEGMGALRRQATFLLARARRRCDDTLPVACVAAMADERISTAEAIGLITTVIGAGAEGTVSALGHCTAHVLAQPGALQRLPGTPQPLGRQADSLLGRIVPDRIHMPRVAARNLQLGSVRVPAGAVLIPVSHFANQQASAPRQSVDHAADSTGHMAFGHGPHICLGAPMARVEIQECLLALADLAPPTLALRVPLHRLPERTTSFVGRYKKIPVRW